MADNYSLWERHEAEQEAWLSKRPVCRHCGEHIQDDFYYYIDGDILCEDCMNDKYRRCQDDYYE